MIMPNNILIVDDSGVTRAVIKRTVMLSGLPDVQMFEAENGWVALDVLAREHIDLVLADLQMPEMGGVELTRRIFADEKLRTIPVVVVSADPNQETIDQLRESGVRAHLPKPFTPEALNKLVKHVLGVVHA
jgi:CheY-like chemotaxis protein